MNDDPNDATQHLAPLADAPRREPGYAGPIDARSATPAMQPTATRSNGAPDAQPQPQPTLSQPMPPVQNIYITQQVQQAFFFGPLGMFYSTVPGALIMLVVSVIAIPLTIGVAAFILWPICMVWAAIAASNANARLHA